ncbi:MAG: hypothetical protein GY859_05615 [Desulfobacterales bacterium]|nr:hypothetical protein [Desulfobacterales bacterium]
MPAKMKYGAVVIFVFCASLIFPFHLSAGEKETMVCAGCKTEYYLIRDLCAAFREKSGIKVRPAKTGNKKAIELMLKNKVDFTFTCKPIDALAMKFKVDREKIASWRSVSIAKDPIVILSNAKNGVDNITVAQLTDIFQGRITNWKEVGGADLPVLTVRIDPGVESGMLPLFKEFTVGKDGKLAPNAKLLDAPSKLGNYVRVKPGGVSFLAINSYQEHFGDILKIDGMAPSREAIINGSYKLAATYYLIIDDKSDKPVSDFLNFCLSEEGKKIIGKNFIPYFE